MNHQTSFNNIHQGNYQAPNSQHILSNQVPIQQTQQSFQKPVVFYIDEDNSANNNPSYTNNIQGEKNQSSKKLESSEKKEKIQTEYEAVSKVSPIMNQT